MPPRREATRRNPAARAAGADLDARDGNGRTPLHVAAFAGHRAAAQALLAAKADPGLLDEQRYDAVTIAAVRDDPAMVRDAPRQRREREARHERL